MVSIKRKIRLPLDILSNNSWVVLDRYIFFIADFLWSCYDQKQSGVKHQPWGMSCWYNQQTGWKLSGTTRAEEQTQIVVCQKYMVTMNGCLIKTDRPEIKSTNTLQKHAVMNVCNWGCSRSSHSVHLLLTLGTSNTVRSTKFEPSYILGYICRILQDGQLNWGTLW